MKFLNTISRCRNIVGGIFSMVVLGGNVAFGQGTVISVSGPFDPPSNSGGNGLSLGVGGFMGAVGWASTAAFSDVDISIAFRGDAGGEGVAYLMTYIGRGATTADEVVEASFAFPATSSMTTVFSGFDLGPGTYYLVIQQTVNGNAGFGWWFGTSSQTVNLAAGVSSQGQYHSIGQRPPSYPPASDFITIADALVYNVTSVPEPSAWWLMVVAGGVGAMAVRRGRG